MKILKKFELLLLSLLLFVLFGSCNEKKVSFRELMSGDYTEVEYKNIEGNPIKMYVFYPELRIGKNRTAVMIIHGGGWTGGETDTFFPHARYFASRGAVSFCIDYRLVKNGEVTLSESLSDCKSAVRYIRKNAEKFGINPDKIIVIGDSAGGHLTACLGTIKGYNDVNDDISINDAPNMAVLCNPLTDFTKSKFLRVIAGGDALDWKNKFNIDTVSVKTIELAKSFSPLYNVKKNDINTLIIHGTADTVIPYKQSEKLFNKMKYVGNVCELITLDGAGHAFICVKWRSSEKEVVNVVHMIDDYMAKYGYLDGKSNLVVSNPIAWTPKY